ncbi:hypothetical protein ACOMHN_026500 [Nucella lapillus]
MSMMRARVRGHRWVDHPAAAVMKARVPGQWVDCPAAVVMEAREQGRCWIDHPAVAVMEARVQGRHWVDRPSVGTSLDITDAHATQNRTGPQNGTTAPNGTEAGNQGGHPNHEKHTVHVLAFEFEAVKEPLIFTVVVLLAGLSKIGFHHANFLSSKIPESCLLIVLGTVFGAILHFSKVSEKLPEFFNPHYFFLFLLPPIILESAFSLYDRTFFENFGSVLLFAVLGTVISCFVIGLSLFGLMKVGAMGSNLDMPLVQILIFSALIVAVDPVAVLAVFSEVGVNDVLYFIVFGESLLNDGVTVVLYHVMQTFNLMDSIPADQFVLGVVKFVVVCFGGLLIGIISGLVTALLTRVTVRVGVAQPLVIYTMAYLGFLLCEVLEVSGIISNINHKSRTTVKYFTKVLATASEIIIFLFLGLELVSESHFWHTGFVVWTLVLCTAFRFLITYGMAYLINRFDTMRVRRIGYDEMFIIAFGGLRGAVAFSLAALLDEGAVPQKGMFVTTTLFVVMFTVFVQGITIKPLVNFLSIKLASGKNHSMYCELNNHVTDHLMAGIEDLVGKKGRNHIRERIEQIDADYFKKWLMNEPDPVDTNLQEFYTKIVIKEHYNNLKLCGAVNVKVPETLPVVDTELYLHSMREDSDAALATREEQEQEAEEPQMRRQSKVSRRSVSSNLQGLRDILNSRRLTRMNYHHTFDRNILADSAFSFQRERCSSWGDHSALIAVERQAEGAGASAAIGASKRAVSLDMGSHSVAYRPQDNYPQSPRTPLLPSLSEENEEHLPNSSGKHPLQKQQHEEEEEEQEQEQEQQQQQTSLTASLSENPSGETEPLMREIQHEIAVAFRPEPAEPSAPSSPSSSSSSSSSSSEKGRTESSSRKRLHRQDDIRSEDPRPPKH